MQSLYKLSLISLFFVILACSSSEMEERNIIGSPIDQAGAGGTMQMFETSGRVYFSSFDTVSRRINFVDPEANALSFSPELEGGSRAWLSTRVDGYAFEITGNTVGIRTNGFQSKQDGLKLPGTIKSWASDLPQGYFAFVDEFFSIGLLEIGVSGEVLRQWIGGPIVNGLSSVTAGEMVDGGKLLLLVNGGSLLVVDMDATLQSQGWVFEQKTLNIAAPSWIGRVEGRGDRALIYGSAGMHLVDLSNGSILQTLSSKGFATLSKNGHDHVSYFDHGTQSLVIIRSSTPDTLQESRFKLLGERVRKTYLSAESLVVATEEGSVIKFRLNDGLVLGKFTLKGEGRLGLSDGYVVAMYDSALGAIEVHNFASGNSVMFEAFNLSVLQK